MSLSPALLGLLAGAVVGSLASGAEAAEGPAAGCAALAAFPDATLTVASAQPVAASPNGPAHCRLKATVRPVPGSQIGFVLWLPTTWNGKLQMYGNGGYSASIPTGPMAEGLRAGYAVVGTDTGHQGDDPDFARGKPEAIVDWGHRAVHESVVKAKVLTAAFYGAPARYAYFQGCSTGGHQGLSEAQRYPADFDGIIAGNPASNRTRLNTAFVWQFRANHTPRDNAAQIIPDAKLPMVGRAVFQACRAANGSAAAGGHASDPYLNDPLSCRFDPVTIQCAGADAADCLTAPQVAAMRAMYRGAHNPRTGERIYFGWPVGGEQTWAAYWADGADRTRPQRINFWRVWAFDDNWNWWDFDFDADMKAVDDRLAPLINATDPDLQAFRQRGGKLIQYHGLADTTVPAADSVSYYERVLDANGGDLAAVGEFHRLFLAPGMGHCGGGPGPNVLTTLQTALENWVERGVAPQQILAAKFPDDDRKQPPALVRPLCPYPQVSRYRSGPPQAAASFACAPGTRRQDLPSPAPAYLR